MRMRVARLLVLSAMAFALAYGAFFLFGPTSTRCSITTIASAPGLPAPTPGPQICTSQSLVEAQREHLFPAPLLWILMWSSAPVLAWFGLRLRARGDRGGGRTLMALAFFMDLSGLPSMGGGFVYALLVAPLLLFAFFVTPDGEPAG